MLAANLTWLAGYRRPYVLDERTAALVLADTAALRNRCWPQRRRSVIPIAVLPTLFHLLWTGSLRCDMDRPLTDHTLIWRDRG